MYNKSRTIYKSRGGIPVPYRIIMTLVESRIRLLHNSASMAWMTPFVAGIFGVDKCWLLTLILPEIIYNYRL